jgi:multicomponent Na+:H+ antiporter subunit D
LLLLFPILLPIVGGFFVFRQNIEKTRNRMVIATLSLTAVLVIVLCLLPTQTLELLPIQGSLELSLETDGLSRFFMLLMTCIWVPVSVFSFPYMKHTSSPSSSWGSTP